MASSKFSESPIRDEEYTEVEDNLTVVVADSADLTFDEEAVESLIESSGTNKSVTFVRMENSGTISEPIIMDIIPSDELLDGTGIIELLTDSFIDSDPLHNDQSLEMSAIDHGTSSLNSNANSPTKRGPPQRRSQRQIDREMQEEANRIKKENQETFKKEREALQKSQNALTGSPADAKVEESNSTVEETKVNSSVTEATPTQIGVRGKKAKLVSEVETVVEISPSRPKRQRKLPAHLQSSDFEFGLASVLRVESEVREPKKKIPAKTDEPQPPTNEIQAVVSEEEIKEDMEKEAEDTEDKEEDASDEDWDSEDDPERLWCICNKPHNNKFMICCDNCKDWFHGQCVGITKKMGQDLEEAQATWTCPSCEKNPDKATKVDASEISTDRNLESPIKKPKMLQGKRKKDSETNEKKPKERTCIECEKPPLQLSSYCSDECIVKHVVRAKDRFKRVRMTSNLKSLAKGESKIDSAKDHLVVVDSFSNTMLSGINAPTEANLEDWLKAHSSYYVVLPSEVSPKMFYGSKPTPPKIAKFTTPHREITKEEKLAQYNAAKNSALSSLQAKKKLLEESGETPAKRDSIKRTNSAEKDNSKRMRRPSESASHPRHTKETTSPGSASKSKPDQKQIRENARKGIREALKLKVSKTTDIKIRNEDLDKLSEVIEEEMFNLYQRDIGTKYKNKYRSLVFNIRDEKNNGLFRKIINGTFLPRQLVRMTADQMASKELQEWREAELRNDIEKIKSYELDMIALGSQFVMKSHKGEQLIEKDELIDSTVKASTEVKLPEDMLPKNDGTGEKSKIGEKTWDHGNHPFLSTCDVCTGKMSLNDFVVAKMERAKKLEEERRRRAKRSRSRDRHRSHGKSKHKSRSKDERKHRSRSRDRHSSKDKGGNNNEKGQKESGIDANKSQDSNTPSESKNRPPGVSSSKDHHVNKSGKDSHSSANKSSRHSSSKSSRDGHGNSSSSRSKDRHTTGSSRKEHHKSGSKERHSSSTSSSTKHHHHKSSSHHRSSSSSKHKSSSKSTDEKTSKISTDEAKVELDRPKTPDIEKPQEITCEAIQKALNVIQESLSQKVPEVCEDTGEVIFPIDDPELSLSPKTETEDADTKLEKIDPDEPYDPSIDISEDMVESPKENKLKAIEKSRSGLSVWQGSLIMEEVSKMSVPLTAYRAYGICDYLEEDFREHLRICGRIQPDTVWDYLGKISENPSKEILVVQFETTGGSHQNSYKDLFNYFKQRNRFGVVDLEKRGPMLKDFYIIPLGAKERLHSCVPFEGPGISNDDSDVLVGLVIRNRRRRTGDPIKPKSSASYSSGSVKSKPPPISTPSLSYIPTPQTSDQAPYDPATMTFADDLDSVSSDGDDEAYDPDSAFPAYKSSQQENNFNKKNDEKQSSNEGSDSNESESPLPGLGDLPKGIANILFRTDSLSDPSDKFRDPRKRGTETSAPAPASSTLSSISDAELLAIAARQTEDDPYHNLSKPYTSHSSSHGSQSSSSHSTDYQPSKSHTRHDSWKDRPDPWRPKSHDEDDTRESSGWGHSRPQSWDRRRDERSGKSYSKREKEWADRR